MSKVETPHVHEYVLWAISSAARMSDLHSEDHWFESSIAYQISDVKTFACIQELTVLETECKPDVILQALISERRST